MCDKEEITKIFKIIKEGNDEIDEIKLKSALELINNLFPGEETFEIHKLVRDLKIFIKQNATLARGGQLNSERTIYKEVLEMLRDLADARCIDQEWDPTTGELIIDDKSN